ncbi:DNA glycosylase [Xylariomycetidae sp. FL0641]|nr:DNA glycosylase [Xylariomycetidae sp. FL0641]
MSTRRSARLSAASATQSDAPSTTTAMAPPPAPAPAKRGRKRKADAEVDKANDMPNGQLTISEVELAKPVPTTPNKRRAPRATTAPPPPMTPTPSDAKLMGSPAAGATTPTPGGGKLEAERRLADPTATNARLVSPSTSRVVTSTRAAAAAAARRSRSPTKAPLEALSPSSANDISPSLPGSGGEVTTTGSLLDEANAYLVRVDPRLGPLIAKNHCRVFSAEGLAEKIDPFESLCSGIISQQVSGAAAKAIKRRFVDLFYPSAETNGAEKEDDAGKEGEDEGKEAKAKRKFPTPEQVLALPLETLRTAGLSQRKAEYVSGLADKFVAGELSARLLADAPYEEVLARLTAVRGLGRWSVEMFACFALKRMDVFSTGDLGVQRGMAAFEGRDVARLKAKGGGKFKYMAEAEMEAIAAKFSPYRSLFMWYMWRVEETDVSTME